VAVEINFIKKTLYFKKYHKIKSKVGGACSIHGRGENLIFWFGEGEERRQLGC
jgi:hypothetical protein